MPTPITPPNTETFVYHSLDALRQMRLAEIEALWDLVPTERQRLYKAIYERTRRDEGAAGADTLEAELVDQLLLQYAQKGLVPVGAYWVPTPEAIQVAAQTDTGLATDASVVQPTLSHTTPLVLGIGALSILVLGFLLLHGLSGNANPTPAGTHTLTPTPTLAHTWTPTPFALDAQDNIIRSGNASGVLVPVNLRIISNGQNPPRVFVVQRRAISMAEWTYEDNPDVASYIAGLIVRPVLGIPWSAANAALFEQIAAGNHFDLQLNTGAVLHFTFVGRKWVNRSDTSDFRQSAPGLVLTLIGERNPDTDQATPGRLIVLANYVPENEAISLTPVPTLTTAPTATPAERVDVQLVSTFTQPGQLILRLRLYNGRTVALPLDENAIDVMYGYTERPVGPSVLAELPPLTVAPGQAVDLTLHIAWHGEPFALLNVLNEYQYSIALR